MKNSTLLLPAIIATLLLAGCGQSPTASTPATDAAQAPPPPSATVAPAPQAMTPPEPSNTPAEPVAPPRVERPRTHPAPAPVARNPPANNYPANPPPVAYGPPAPPAYPPPNQYPPPSRYPPPPRGYPGPPIGGPPDARLDAGFYHQALAGGEMEVRLSQLAVTHSQNPQIRRLAQVMIRDHSDMNAELSAISRIGRVPASDEIAIAQLAGMSGPNFDQRYLSDLVAGHRNTITLFQEAARNARSETTRRLAADALPKLQGHLGAVQRTQQAIGQNFPRR